jgi:hypothetical protein
MTFRDVATIAATTFVLVHLPGRPAANVTDELVVEIDTAKPKPIQVVTVNEHLLGATTNPGSQTQAYGVGAQLSPADARRLAAALNEAADELDPRPPSGGAFSINLGG